MNDITPFAAGVAISKLTYEDLALALDALAALESEAGKSDLNEMLLGTMLSRTKEEAGSSMERAEKARDAKAPGRRLLKEGIAILRAKLLLWRRELDSQETERAFDDARETKTEPGTEPAAGTETD